MTALALIEELKQRGICLQRRQDRLRVEGPSRLLTGALRGVLMRCKLELLAVVDGDWIEALNVLMTDHCQNEQVADLRVRFEERAAIAEYDGNLPRSEAERIAYIEIAAIINEKREFG
jgi:hypothetical protein